MNDPVPENITGSKIHKHTFEHSIRWDYMAIAVVVGFVVWKFSQRLSSSGERDDRADGLDELAGSMSLGPGTEQIEVE